MLINQYAGSGGDLFPWMFRHSKVGPLIGKRTWGGLVGISQGAPLVDGGSVTAPEFGIYDRDTGQWIAENKAGKAEYQRLWDEDLAQPIEQVGAQLRQHMAWLEADSGAARAEPAAAQPQSRAA